MNVAGIVLAGGASTRMGRDKATMPFGTEVMLQRVVRILAPAVSPIVVVASAGQHLPPLPPDVLIARDERPGRGPLEGILAGLSLLATERPDVEAAFVTSCDVPLLLADFVRALVGRLGSAEVAVAVEGNRAHPLSAVYRVSVLSQVRALLTADERRAGFLLDRLQAVMVNADELRPFDPELGSLLNCNRPEDYARALRQAGFSTR